MNTAWNHHEDGYVDQWRRPESQKHIIICMIKRFSTMTPTPRDGETQSLQQIVLGQLDIHIGKKLDTYATQYTKTNANYVKALNVKGKTIKKLEENMVNIGFGSDFLGMT